MNIVENNRLTAEFMGYSFKPLPHTNYECYKVSESWDIIHVTDFETGCFAYHSDWNRLMSVITKITTFDEFQNKYEFNELFWDTFTQLDINDIYQQVVLFIKWYKDNK